MEDMGRVFHTGSMPAILHQVTTTIGLGSPNKANSYSVDGSALGAKEVEDTRQNLGWPYEPFHVPDEVKKGYIIEEKMHIARDFLEKTTCECGIKPAQVCPCNDGSKGNPSILSFWVFS